MHNHVRLEEHYFYGPFYVATVGQTTQLLTPNVASNRNSVCLTAIHSAHSCLPVRIL